MTNYKYFISFLYLLLVSSISFGQIGMGEWRIHSANTTAKDVVSSGNSIYFAYEAALLEFDKKYSEYSTLDVTNGLSDIKLTKLGKHNPTNSIFVGYENGNIDQIINGQPYNIPGIKLANILGKKQINSFKSHGNFVYAATGFGVVKIDPKKTEIKDTYYPTGGSEEVVEICFIGDSIFAITPTRLYKGNLNNPALADSAQWTVDTRVRTITNPNFNYLDVEVRDNKLYVLQNYSNYAHDSIFVVQAGTMQLAHDLGDYGRINSLQEEDGKFYINGDEFFIELEPGTNFQSNDLLFHFYQGNQPISIRSTCFFDGKYWFADNNWGAVKRNGDWDFEKLPFKGTYDHRYFRAKWNKGTLAVVPGLLKGQADNYVGPSLMLLKDEEWSFINKENGPKWDTLTWDNSSISFNPTNENLVAVGGRSITPLSIVDISAKTVLDTFGFYNAPFTKQANGSILISDVSYDDNGNLWVLNASATSPLKLYKDNQWHSINIGPNLANKRTNTLFYDYDGNFWITTSTGGLIGYNPGDDPVSTSDDKRIYLNTSDYSGALPANNVTALAMDFDNRLWVGTESGFGVLYNPAQAFDATAGNYNVYRPKVTINGETDYILGSTNISDIEVDGGNRKWIATANSGMVLLSADGLEVVKHFTVDNSPLISNTILDLEINQKTGEVFVLTDKGMMSYRNDASYEDATYSDVKIFPNPARPNFDGPITIQGIRYDSDVKITDVAGNVVYQTTSRGGTATWDGKTVHGERVASGVYLIWTASNIQKGRFVGKVVVIN